MIPCMDSHPSFYMLGCKSIIPQQHTSTLQYYQRTRTHLIVFGADHQGADGARRLRVLLQRLHARHHRLLRRRHRAVGLDEDATAGVKYTG